MTDLENTIETMGDVNLSEIQNILIDKVDGLNKDMLSLNDITRIIGELHMSKITNNAPSELSNSIMNTTNILNSIDVEKMKQEGKDNITTIKNIYNSVSYYIVFITLKKSGDNELIENAKRDIVPVIKQYWDLVCE
tara:strand:- start:180 stop:587 length:408 start_codon:yes stop_codon:yes gene_type:complete